VVTLQRDKDHQVDSLCAVVENHYALFVPLVVEVGHMSSQQLVQINIGQISLRFVVEDVPVAQDLKDIVMESVFAVKMQVHKMKNTFYHTKRS